MTNDRRARHPAIEIIAALRRWTGGVCLVVASVGQLVAPAASVYAAASPFIDIAGTPFEQDIEWLYAEGITTGCYPTLYCPDARVRRDEMASFLARMFDLPPTATDFFTDDNANIHEDNINRVAAAGITMGCMPQKYCPAAWVRRDQMASFLARAIPLTVGGDRDYFRDDNANPHEPNIDKIAAAGIGSGCGAWRYCPDWTFTRGQMAAFLHRVAVPLGAVLPYPAPPAGQTMYVAIDGSDAGNDCMTEAAPCRTIGYALQIQLDGDEIQVGSGTFVEGLLSISADLAIHGDPAGETVIDFTGLGSYQDVLRVLTADPLAIDHLSIEADTNARLRTDGALSIDHAIIRPQITKRCDYPNPCDPGPWVITDATVSGGATAADTLNITRSIVGPMDARSVTIADSTVQSVVVLPDAAGTFMLITDSTVSGSKSFESAHGDGVTVFANANGSHTIIGSTITANDGVGVHAYGDLTIANSTIAGNGLSVNTPSRGGTKVEDKAVLTILNSTITANTGYGSGIMNWDASTVILRNAIVIGNKAPNGDASDISGAITSQTASIVAVPLAAVPGILDSTGLADHGGPTETVALVDSPTNAAVNHGDAATCAAVPISSLDQRGLPRVAPCDIGAFELQP